MILPSCETGTKTKEIEVGVASQNTTYCRAVSPICWSSKDTDQTIASIKIHNAKYKAVCPPKRCE